MQRSLENLGINLKDREPPNYIAVEGPIGVGKTTLVRGLAETFNYSTLMELPVENPFLERFYQDRRTFALPTQLYFLFQRHRQLEEMRQADIFNPLRVADFLMEKDPLFAEVNLEPDELRLYQNVYDQLTLDAPQPDLVIYLQAPTSVLLERIQRRGNASERGIDVDYVTELNDAYTRFFHTYNDAPLLIVNAAVIDLSSNVDHYRDLVEYMLDHRNGRSYYNPAPLH